MSFKDKIKNSLKFKGKVKKFALAVYGASLIAICTSLSLNIPAIVSQNKASDLAEKSGFTEYYQTYKEEDSFLGIPNLDKKLAREEKYMQTNADENALEEYNQHSSKRKALNKASSTLAVCALATSVLATGVAKTIEKKKDKER